MLCIFTQKCVIGSKINTYCVDLCHLDVFMLVLATFCGYIANWSGCHISHSLGRSKYIAIYRIHQGDYFGTTCILHQTTCNTLHFITVQCNSWHCRRKRERSKQQKHLHKLIQHFYFYFLLRLFSSNFSTLLCQKQFLDAFVISLINILDSTFFDVSKYIFV